MYAPKSDDNPYRIGIDMQTTEERMQIALWYPFSVRCFIELDARWMEMAICPSRDKAYHAMLPPELLLLSLPFALHGLPQRQMVALPGV